MKNKVLFSLVIIIVFICGVIYAAGLSSEEAIENVLGESLQSSGADILESTISSWSKINNEFMSAEEITAQIDKIIMQLNVEEDSIMRTAESSEAINKEILYAAKDNKNYIIALESINNEDNPETYIIVDVSIDKSCDDLINEKEKLELMLGKEEELLKYSSCVIGTFDGRLSAEEMQQVIDKALSTVAAREVEKLEDEEMSSISAFSDSIGDYIISNNQKVNMQIAMRYSSYDDKTYIWIGSPLINIEY